MKSFRAAAGSTVEHTVRVAFRGAARSGSARPSGPARQSVFTCTVAEGEDSGWGCAGS
ncbi:hypothetical protein [Streptomyces sp. YIM S03343]